MTFSLGTRNCGACMLGSGEHQVVTDAHRGVNPVEKTNRTSGLRLPESNYFCSCRKNENVDILLFCNVMKEQ